MPEIRLTTGEIALIDEEDRPRLVRYSWHNRSGYASACVGGKPVFMHRLVMNAKPGQIIDHANRNRLDNRKDNLRVATPSQNAANAQFPTGSSRYRGVASHPCGRWQAHVTKDGHTQHLGMFDTEEEAARAYNAAASEHFGEFALPNEVTDNPVLHWVFREMELGPLEETVAQLHIGQGLAYPVIAERLAVPLEQVRETGRQITLKVERYRELLRDAEPSDLEAVLAEIGAPPPGKGEKVRFFG